MTSSQTSFDTCLLLRGLFGNWYLRKSDILCQQNVLKCDWFLIKRIASMLVLYTWQICSCMCTHGFMVRLNLLRLYMANLRDLLVAMMNQHFWFPIPQILEAVQLWFLVYWIYYSFFVLCHYLVFNFFFYFLVGYVTLVFSCDVKLSIPLLSLHLYLYWIFSYVIIPVDKY
jgi:hypothetical protein